jgi:hypothetical protein
LIADREEGDVVVVGRVRPTHEDVLPVWIVDDRAETEHVGVEALLATGVADVEHGMVHPCDPHRASLLIVLASSHGLTVVALRRGLMVRP